jgi:DNA-damage-inducible protein J
MGKISAISARIDPEIINGGERVFRELGLPSSQGITLFYKQIELQ